MITNENENKVLSLSIDHKGMLAAGSLVATGGAGDANIAGSTNEPAPVDPLASQSSLTVAGMVRDQWPASAS